jgi:diamine N-acetyltransferase
MPTEKVILREVTEETLESILKLQVAEDQERFVASNAKSIAQACFSDRAWYRAIYAGDTPVGFVMLYLDKDKPEYWIWRFMIDKQYQRLGYGSQALAQVIQHVKGLPEPNEIVLSYTPGEGEPAPFYQKFGFIDTGQWEEEEKVMKLYL